jgi:two-component system response regulator AlgR
VRVLVVDDEQPARERLKQLLNDEADYEFAGEAENGMDAVRLAAELLPDIVLLDIRMPGLDGIETAHHLAGMANPPAVVFATAYDEYAIDAFDARAVGYVLKPVRRARLTAALDQASKLAPSKLNSVASEAGLPFARNHVCARARGKLRLIPIAEIHCFRADQKYVTVDHDKGCDLIDEPLKKLAEEFSDEFVRIHRGAWVAVKYIDRIEKTEDGRSLVVLRENSQVEDKELIISRRHLAEVRRRLKGG